MSTKITETDLELHAIELLESQGYHYLAPEAQEQERENLTEVILKDRLQAAIDRINLREWSCADWHSKVIYFFWILSKVFKVQG